jgi:hypothetical protein
MPSMTAEPAQIEEVRAEVQAVLQSATFLRSPGLTRLLSYLCDKVVSGETAQIKEYSVALDVFGRKESFDQDSDSIVRVQANRLRKRLAEYYAGEGRTHRIQITIPIGQYVPAFQEQSTARDAPSGPQNSEILERKKANQSRMLKATRIWAGFGMLLLIAAFSSSLLLFRSRINSAPSGNTSPFPSRAPNSGVGLPVGDEIRILAGSSRSYVDRSGKLWSPDAYFTGGTEVRSSVQHIWRTQDSTIYRTSRQGDFRYDIPVKAGTYELHLHFAETFYGPEDAGGGGEGSRVMTVSVNGRVLIPDLDVLADAAGGRTADVKIFTGITPDSDGLLHLGFSSVNGRAMLSAIEIVPGYRDRMRPVRIVAREVPYYSNDSQWWSSDTYFKGGQLAGSEEPASETDDPELYETERWGHFSYAIPVTKGRYRVSMHFVERTPRTGIPHSSDPVHAQDADRVFDVFCNGKMLVRHLNLQEEIGDNRPFVKRVSGLEPNAQGKLLLEFVPLNRYATISAIEVLPE